ncbi:Gluconolactonase [Klebsiella quasipneumoniae]|uniref:L-dopachrome tautomerase-related protein n=1 Tax=Klebsiella quasipneumoniae subsp. quasipneumoniae TaxID=1667327 RepID=A0AAN2CFX2_9ENTR|nr:MULTISPECIES: L-dopachrome tautomerase-related protein [Klebsiella]MDS0459642.1 major royal jelly family protein [Klebsiella pneumoniae]HDZ9754080.1 SMP-30/gluconolactonase/LRE family protein [Klebsiella quasipneumoniae subsp. similipneumoniae]EKY4131406.1 SMP-30/gluconolactonase/LRE family protein [Klebsiella quasipneumoniae]ELT0943439.1 SMP-30/gluconolactonase/LRE family protein [Klebsiella quasipneumoniae]EMB9113569.1 SMP-30/gluconolactonase/LRE family protein [Klebsiella quasipneumoniae
MHRFSLVILGLLSLGQNALAAGADDPAHLALWRSYAGVTWEQRVDARSVDAPIAGLHFDAAGRAFVSTPRLISPQAPATLSLLDTASLSGPARLTAFPSTEANSISADPRTHLRNVLGFYVDHRNGWLWALDQGFVAGEKTAPPEAQKIMIYALSDGKLVQRIPLDSVADREGSFLNDIVVDEARRVAYIADSGLRSAPDNQAGLIVVDAQRGTVRRVLNKHPALMPVAGLQVTSHGETVWPGNPIILGINGIALSPDQETLYWTVTTGTTARTIATAALRDPAMSERQLAAAIRTAGEVGGNSDGIVVDKHGALYITDVTHNGIVRYRPQSGQFTLLAADERVYWPDTPTIGPDGAVMFTASHLNQHFAQAVKPGEEKYTIWKVVQP